MLFPLMLLMPPCPRLIPAIAGLAFLVRLGAALALGGFSRAELFEYDDIARSLASGGDFVYPHLGIPYYSYSPPLYPWICAGIYTIGGGIAAILLLQIAVSAAHVWLTGALASRMFGAAAGLVAALLMTVHPGLVIYSATKAHPLTFDAFFFTAILWCVIELCRWPSLRTAAFTGAVVGVGTLSRATALIFLGVGGLWLIAVSGRDVRPGAVRHVALAVAVALLVVAPWTIRNILLHRQFVFQVTVDNEVFWRGNNPAATGHSYVDAGRIVLDQLPAEVRADLFAQRDELAQSLWFHDRAMSFIRSEPGAFVRLTLQKFGSFWWWAPQTGVRYPPLWRFGYLAYYLPVLGLALFGTLMLFRGGSPRQRREAALIVLFALSLSALQSLYYVEGRHRWAVEPMVIALAGAGAASLVPRG